MKRCSGGAGVGNEGRQGSGYWCGRACPDRWASMPAHTDCTSDLICNPAHTANLPQVDPIIASHAGGAVGIMTAQLLSSNKQRRQ